MNILGLIPARGGSKSIPHKNIVPLAGKPLLAYTCEAALGSALVSRVIVSTDDEAIAEVARACEVEVPFMRPAELARDDTPSYPVAQHAVRWLAEAEGWQTDILVLLQATSPLRRSDHIDSALKYMLDKQADTVVSVVEVPHNFTPSKLMVEENGVLQNYLNPSERVEIVQRQAIPQFFARNGPAILACRSSILLERNNFYGDKIVPYLMGRWDSLDIDEPDDLQFIEQVMTLRHVEERS